MESWSEVASSTLAIFLVLHLGLIPIMAQQDKTQTGFAGQVVILNCGDLPHQTDVTWKYYRFTIRLFRSRNLKGKAPMTERSEIEPNSKHLKVWDLRLSDAGIYTCECGSHTVRISLHVFKLTISLNGHFLPNEVPTLTLMHNASLPLPNLDITLFNSNNNIVTPEVSQDKIHQQYTLQLMQLKAMDSGTWRCHVHSDSPLINQNISFDIKVLGFQNPDLVRKYTAVDSSVTLSWHLNFQKIKWKEGFTGKLNLKTQENASAYELLDFNVTAQERHETKKSRHLQFEIPERKPESTIEVKLPKVHFNHSGQYECQLAYNGRYTQSNIELVVMKVSANPAGPLTRGADTTLICQVSRPLPSNVHLRWERVNGTQVDIKKSKQHEAKVEVKVSSAGLWNCDLIEDNDRKISLHYPVEEAPIWVSYMKTGIIVGGCLLVVGFVGLGIIIGIKWQRRRQRAKRMAKARQYLLENKICQCQQWLGKCYSGCDGATGMPKSAQEPGTLSSCISSSRGQPRGAGGVRTGAKTRSESRGDPGTSGVQPGTVAAGGGRSWCRYRCRCRGGGSRARPSIRSAPWLLGPAVLPLPSPAGAPRPSPLAVAPPGGWMAGARGRGGCLRRPLRRRGRGSAGRAEARRAAQGARRHGSACSGER
ncbi:T-cell surface glycoprotein CD4-like [Phaethornis superciliosus]